MWRAGAAECRDTFVRFDNLASTSAGRTPPATGVSTLDECRARCLSDDDCAGFNWMRDGLNDTDKCLLYDGLVGDTSEVTLFDLYARERCQPNMFITFGPGMPLMGLLQLRYEHDSSTIRLRFERDTTSYEELCHLCAFEQ